jgi:hypothetical protein
MAEAALGKGETVIARFALKSRIARLLPGGHPPEESFKGMVNPFQHILQHLAMHQRYIWTDFLDFRQLIGLAAIGERYPAHPVGIASFLKPGIIEFTANVEGRREFLLHGGTRINSELERLSHWFT